MDFIGKKEGITMIEVVIVSVIIGVIIAITGTISGKFADRRSVDRITMNISSTLQIMKLKALRHGLEYQAAFAFNSGEKTLTIVTQRGNSNRGSDEYENETSQTIRVEEGLTITPANKTYNFNPNGTLGGTSGTVTIRPTTENITRCGRIVVSPFGRIRVIQGNWDGTNCNAVK
jgi:Tfp pilus assembly protein FimT